MRTATAARSSVLGPHVRVAHQHHRLAAAVPGEGLEAGLVVVVVRALALRDVAPGAGHVAGGEAVLQEVQRKSFVGQHRARQRLAFRRRELLGGEPRGLLQGAQVEPGIDADGVDLGAGLERQLRVFLRASCRCAAGAAGSGRCWTRRGSRTAGSARCSRDVRGAQRVQALGAQGLVLDHAPHVAHQVLLARASAPAGAVTAIRAEVDLQLRRRRRRPAGSSARLRARCRACPCSSTSGRRRSRAAPPSRCTAGATPWLAVGGLRAQALLVRRRGPRSRAARTAPCRSGSSVLDAPAPRCRGARDRPTRWPGRRMPASATRAMDTARRTTRGASDASERVQPDRARHAQLTCPCALRGLPRRSAAPPPATLRADRRSAVTNSEPIVSCVRAIGTTIAQWSALT